jgi:hypothetical protein
MLFSWCLLRLFFLSSNPVYMGRSGRAWAEGQRPAVALSVEFELLPDSGALDPLLGCAAVLSQPAHLGRGGQGFASLRGFVVA